MSAPATATGQVLEGRYRLADVIGVGGMATVYLAHDDVLARDVAVKLFPPAGAVAEQERQRAEVAVLARLNHPGLVSLLDAGTFGSGVGAQTYIVMELVRGPTLADLLSTGPLRPEHAAALGAQLAAALAAVHRAGVVHRDVKPANILIGDASWSRGREAGPVAKLADFGIARVADAARLTATGTTLGTATYLSPEQAAGGAVGPPSDVYSLGLVLLECLTGRKAFTGTVAEVAAARLFADPEIPEAVGRPWSGLLRRMTRRDPAERVTAAEVAASLADLVTRAEPTVVLASDGAAPPAAVRRESRPDEPARPARARHGRWSRRRTTAAAVGALLVAGALAGAALWPEAPAAGVREQVTPEVGGALGEALRDLVSSVEP